jgi:manganese efflux pump family protein
MGIQLLILGLIIGSNNLAIAMAIGALGQIRRIRRIVGFFGLFEFFVPLAGFWIGRQAAEEIGLHSSWIAPLLLVLLGGWTIRSAFKDSSKEIRVARMITSWPGLVILSLIISLDNLIVGFSLGLRGADPLRVALTISLFAMCFTWVGIRIGSVTRRHWEQYAEIGAGILLLGLAGALWKGWI